MQASSTPRSSACSGSTASDWSCPTRPRQRVEDVISDFIYVRLQGTKSKYAGTYPDAALERWAARIETWRSGSQPSDARLITPKLPTKASSARDVVCYFDNVDNDVKTQAPFDARRLMARLGLQRAGPATPPIEPCLLT